MRRPDEIKSLIVRVAQDDARIRAVLLTGSRANPDAPIDIFQDFDVVYVVGEIGSFVRDQDWIAQFGETLIVQRPEEMGNPPPSNDGTYAYLMLFTDGNRIDLTLCPFEILSRQEPDSMTLVLLDKDGTLGTLPAPSQASYILRAPTEKEFADCSNEFFWMCTYVAKGLWRNEIVYAKSMYELFVRPQALRMLDWYIGMSAGFAVNLGKYGKLYKRYLPQDLWILLEQSYSDADIGNSWAALHALYKAFRISSEAVAENCGFVFHHQEADNVGAYLQHVESLPSDAQEIF